MVRRISNTEAAAHAVVAEHVKAAMAYQLEGEAGPETVSMEPKPPMCGLPEPKATVVASPEVEALIDYMRNEPPAHYKTAAGFDVWDILRAFGITDYWHGNCLKYLLRAGRKGPMMDDLVKARNYLNELIAARQLEAE